MRSSLSPAFGVLTIVYLFSSIVSAHIVITYPGWRGNNLFTNGTVEESRGLMVAESNNSSDLIYPYGMQWQYPCGGMPVSQNRTKWPVGGGAIALQPGWFSGHSTAFMYVNMGFGEVPLNMSFNMVPVFQLVGPTRDPYPGTFCLPQVPLPINATAKIGDKATIQIIETALHGAALYNCVDIEFADPSEVEEVNEENCFNSSTLDFELVFSTASLSAASANFPTFFSFLSNLSSASRLPALAIPSLLMVWIALAS